MTATLDLTEPQAARVMEQAIRSGARIELDMRPLESGRPFTGFIREREKTLLRIQLDSGQAVIGQEYVGAFCDVQMMLSGELYQFSSCVIDITDYGRSELVIATPQAIQVMNRRRFVRKAPNEGLTIQLFPPKAEAAFQTTLTNISVTGLSVRGHRGDLDDVLFVGDEVRINIDLPEIGESFELPAVICTKTLDSDRTNMLVGLEFFEVNATEDELATLTRLRAHLNDPSLGFVETDGV
ncbi:MAG: PilZ domain-containing protein [Phycisphaerae bacterium]